jgi:hypothetical protein
MSRSLAFLFILSALLLDGCAGTGQPIALTAIPPLAATGATAVPTFRFMGDECAQEPLRAYLSAFALPMKKYEISLAEIFGLIVNTANADRVTAAINETQTARDSVDAMTAPYCAQKMQTALVSSMDHTVAGLTLSMTGKDQAKVRVEITQAQLDYTTAKTEFAMLSAKAGLEASPTP